MLRKYFTAVSRRYRQKEHPWYMAPLTYLMNHPVYFSVNRKTVTRAIWIGIFVGFLPIPMQMAVAAILAIMARVNIPVAVLGVWITNPLTMVPLFYLAYRLGAAMLSMPIELWPSEQSLLEMSQGMGSVWKAMLYGGVVLGLSVATVAYISVSIIWQVSTAIRYRERRQRRELRDRKAQSAEKDDPASTAKQNPGANPD